MKTKLNPADKAVLLYILFSTITYMGLLLNNYFATYMGLSLTVLLTSYLIAWYLVTSLVLNALIISVNTNHIKTTLKANTYAQLNINSRFPIRLTVKVMGITSPHLVTEPLLININDANGILALKPRWLGHAYIVGFIIEINDPLGIFSARKFIRRRLRIDVEPDGDSYINNAGISIDLVTHSFSYSRTGDYIGITNYDFNEPASVIHWLTSARANELMMTIRSEKGLCPRVLMEFSSRMLLPNGDLRHIDKAIIILANLLKTCTMIKLTLINKYREEIIYLTRNNLLDLEEKLRHYVLSRENTLKGYESMLELPRDDLMLIAYPQVILDDEPQVEQLLNELSSLSENNVLLIVRSEMKIEKIPTNTILIGV